MVALAHIPEDHEQYHGDRLVTADVQTLVAAFQLAYEAGRGDKARSDEALTLIARTCRGMRRSLRRARPTPRVGVEAGLELIELLASPVS